MVFPSGSVVGKLLKRDYNPGMLILLSQNALKETNDCESIVIVNLNVICKSHTQIW